MNPVPETYLRVSHVQKSFGARRIYEDLSLTVNRGEVVTLLGSSGTGKSVLLKLLVGLMRPDAGRIEIRGQNVLEFDEDQLFTLRTEVSMLFQSAALFDSLSVGDNVAYPLRIRKKRSEAEIRDRVAHCLELVGLPGTENSKPAELSGGMRKRVGLARAIAAEPKMVLYDEPTTGLDPINTRRINELILSVRERVGVTSLVVTHDLSSAFLVSDRIAFLAEGRIVAEQPVKDFQHSAVPTIQDFLHAMPPPPIDWATPSAAPLGQPRHEGRQS